MPSFWLRVRLQTKLLSIRQHYLNIDSEWSDECIDVVSFSGLKVNLVGALGRLFFEIPDSFQKHREKSKKKN
ncbi:Uncharacterized protein FWK35_00019524 [Aphis craccivora]|uniref:Uncharacterized protein n=1 Tax=Aphis craccivora TaxID=307492 RepID=A0A6G0YZV8_APHCR|nr:Uncharacterized protein FWK35_00019524 [Aphis craccivora]